jgi:hypothetical protein
MDAGVRRRSIRVLRHLATISLIIAIPYVACHEFWWYQQRFPEKIAVDRLIFDIYIPGVRTGSFYTTAARCGSCHQSLGLRS